MRARLHPHWVGGEVGYVYSVIYDGKLLIERSRDPECDAARALVAKGITGKLTILDGKTGIRVPSSTSRRRPNCGLQRKASMASVSAPCTRLRAATARRSELGRLGGSMSKKDKGRLPPFIPLLLSTLDSRAWREMSHGAQMLYVALRRRVPRGRNRGTCHIGKRYSN